MRTHRLLFALVSIASVASCSRPEVKPRDPRVLMRACDRAQEYCTHKNWMQCSSDRWSCYRLGLWYRTGFKVPKSIKKSRAIFRAMCDRLELASCAALCRRDHEERRCVQLAIMGLCGQGTPMVRPGNDVSRSRVFRPHYLRTFRRACKNGDLVACIVPGMKFNPLTSLAVRYNGNCYNDKRRCYKMACRHGDPMACALLCQVGQPERCVDLAILVLRDQSMHQPRFAQAAKLLEKLCDKNHYRACTELGKALLGGLPLQPDPNRARLLLKKACQGGQRAACRLLTLPADC